MAILMSYAMENEVFKEIVGTTKHTCSSKNNNYLWQHKHRLLLMNDIYSGGKTGFTKNAGRTLVTTATKNDMNLVVVTFNAGNDWNDHQMLFDYGFDNYNNTLILKSQIIGQNSQIYDHFPIVKDDIYYLLKKGEIDNVRINIFLLNNPHDEIIGKVKIYLKNDLIIVKDVYELDVENEDKSTFDYIKGFFGYD